jgi:NADH-quinone oxidoreductase subunit C
MIPAIQTYLASNHQKFLTEGRQIRTNLPYIYLLPEGVVPVIRDLKEHPEFSFLFLNDLTAVDWLDHRSPRFEVLYLLRSPKNKNFLLQIRVPVEEGESVPSLTGVFVGANWPEREVYDLFGIPFANHPYLERIVLPDNFVGHPLRKDYPLEGPGQDYLIQDLLQIHLTEDLEGES